MQLKPGTVNPASSDPTTFEQWKWLSGKTGPNSSYVRAEYRGGVLTAAGAFTFDATVAVVPDARRAEVDAHIAAGSDFSKPEMGYVLALNNDGVPDQYIPCIGTLEQVTAMLANHTDAMPPIAILEVLQKDAEPGAQVIAARTQIPLANVADLYVDAPVAVVPPAVPAPALPSTPPIPFTVDQSHAIDSMPVGSTVTKISDVVISVDHPDTGVTQQTIPPDDVLHTLPVGSTVAVVKTTTLGVEGKSVMVSLPENAFRKEIGVIGKGVHDAIARAWTWVKNEAAVIEKKL